MGQKQSRGTQLGGLPSNTHLGDCFKNYDRIYQHRSWHTGTHRNIYSMDAIITIIKTVITSLSFSSFSLF